MDCLNQAFELVVRQRHRALPREIQSLKRRIRFHDRESDDFQSSPLHLGSRNKGPGSECAFSCIPGRMPSRN